PLYLSCFQDLRKLYALVCKSLDSYKLLSETVLHANFLHAQATEHLTKDTLSADSTGCSLCTLAVLAHDLLLGSGRSKHQLLTRQLYQATADPRAVQKLRRSFREIMKSKKVSIDGEVFHSCPRINLPCYARVNELRTRLEWVRSELFAHGYEEVQYDRTKISYPRFLKQVRKLQANQFLLDYHLPDDLLVFPPGTCLFKLPSFISHGLLVQDKASCIPTKILLSNRDADVLDACAAPGNKTLQLVPMLSSKATLFAIDRDPSRFRRLCDHLKASGVCRLTISGPAVSNFEYTKTVAGIGAKQPQVVALCADFLSLDPQDPKFCHVESILLDPSCSGSGLSVRQPDGSFPSSSSTNLPSQTAVSRDFVGEESLERLKRLANLQAQLLRHALSFPNVNRVVYSTCSLRSEENEAVVCENLERMHGIFKLEPIWTDDCSDCHSSGAAKPHWLSRGLSAMGCEPCLRSSPETDLTNGFFIACFVRVPPAAGLSPMDAEKFKRSSKRSSDDSSQIISSFRTPKQHKKINRQ
ncbi:hypothetical protein AHF37_02407, partial [Paragonimus kellicotti]